MEFVLVHNCPTPKRLAAVIVPALTRSGTTLISCARGKEVEALLRKVGKKSQDKLYWCYQRRVATGVCPPECGGDCNPANPPGQSTHEGRNDGIAFRWWPRFFKIPWWAYGMDVGPPEKVQEFIRELAKEGVTAAVTYPNSPREGHHVNIRKQPTIIQAFKPLRPKSSGPRVELLTRRLKRLGYLKRAYWNYEPIVLLAVKEFQADHKQKVDGVYGKQTHQQVVVAIRNANKNKERK